jgi:NDP-sugar pyrophosphorylase family protein
MTEYVGVVLAAGLGTRLRPATDKRPKPLIHVAGVEPLFFAIYNLYFAGVRKIVVNVHHLHEQIEASLKDWTRTFPGIEIRISHESPTILGTGGALIKIIRESADWFGTRNLVVLNGDTLAGINLNKILSLDQQNSFAISFNPKHLLRYKPLWVDPDVFWTGIGPSKPTEDSQPAHFLGVHTITAHALSYIAQSNLQIEEIDLFNGIYRPLHNAGFRFHGIEMLNEQMLDNFWFDMNTSEFLLEAQKILLDGLKHNGLWKRCLLCRWPDIVEVRDQVWMAGFVPREKIKISLQGPSVIAGEGDFISKEHLNSESFSIGPYVTAILGKHVVRFSTNKVKEFSNSVAIADGSTVSNVKDSIEVF